MHAINTPPQEYISDAGVQKVLQKRPHCRDVLPSLFVVQRQRAPPVWVDAAVSVQAVTATTHTPVQAAATNSQGAGEVLPQLAADSPTTPNSNPPRHLRETSERGGGGGVLATLHSLAERAGVEVGAESVTAGGFSSSLAWWLSGGGGGGSSDQDYSRCLDAYSATLRGDAATAAALPVLYSTHKATPAAEVLCW